MPIAENDVKWVEEPRLGFWEPALPPRPCSTALKTTLGHMVSRKVTEEYPEHEPKLPANYRGVPPAQPATPRGG